MVAVDDHSIEESLLCEYWVDGSDYARCGIRRRGQDDRVEAHPFGADQKSISPAVLGYLPDLAPRGHILRSYKGEACIHQGLHALLQRHEVGHLALFFSLGPALPHGSGHAPDQAPVFPLHVEKPGKNGPDAHVVRVRGVDAGDEGLGDLFQTFLSQSPRHEARQALVVEAFFFGTNNSIPILIFPGQEMRRDFKRGVIMVGTMSITPSGSR